MAWHGMAGHGMAWHGMARHGMVWYGMVNDYFVLKTLLALYMHA